MDTSSILGSQRLLQRENSLWKMLAYLTELFTFMKTWTGSWVLTSQVSEDLQRDGVILLVSWHDSYPL